MSIQLSSEQEQVIGEAIEAGLIRVPADAVEIGFATLRQKLNAERVSTAEPSAEDWSRELSAWVESHAKDVPLLPDRAIDRDSIYGMRGA